MPVAKGQVDGVVAAAEKAVTAAQEAGDVVIAIGNEFRRSDVLSNEFRHNAAIAGSAGAKWDQRIPIMNAVYLAKWRGDAFCNPSFDALLKERGAREVTLAGLYASACVTATAKGALARGLKAHVLADAVADASDSKRLSALERLSQCGERILKTYGQVA
jgi:nicotinamidase-related amidase